MSSKLWLLTRRGGNGMPLYVSCEMPNGKFSATVSYWTTSDLSKATQLTEAEWAKAEAYNRNLKSMFRRATLEEAIVASVMES